jgi:guanylate kinase
MLEFTEYVGNYYGTPYSEIQRIIDSGKTPLLILDINGVRSMKKRALDFEVYSVYLYAPLEVISDRLGERYAAEGEAGLERYLTRMKSNLKDYRNMRLYAELFDSAVESLDIERTTAAVLAAFWGRKCDFSANKLVEMAENTEFSFAGTD